MGVFQNSLLSIFFLSGLLITLLPNFLAENILTSNDSDSSISNPVVDESFFQNIHYFSKRPDSDGLELTAADLTINQKTGKTIFFNPRGDSYTASGKKISYAADKGQYLEEGKILNLEGSVDLTSKDSKINANIVTFFSDKDLIRCEGEVQTFTESKETGDKVSIQANLLNVDTKKNYLSFEGKVLGKVKRKRAYEENVEFASEKMQFDTSENKIYLQEEVVFKKQSVTAFSRLGEIFLENYNKKLKYFVLNDDVRVVEKVNLKGQNNKSFERKAFSEKLEGILSERKIILSGYPKVIQQGDTIRGNLIVLREDIDVIEVDDANTNFKVGN